VCCTPFDELEAVAQQHDVDLGLSLKDFSNTQKRRMASFLKEAILSIDGHWMWRYILRMKSKFDGASYL
jgi:hypothetical protein